MFDIWCLEHKLIRLFHQDEETRNKEQNRPELFKAMQKRNISIAKDEEEKEKKAEQNAEDDQSTDDESDYSSDYSDEDDYTDESEYSDEACEERENGSWEGEFSEKVVDIWSQPN